MSAISQPGTLGKFQIRYDKHIVNATSETIPSWSIVQVTAATTIGSEESYTVTKPNGTAKAKYLLTGPQWIAPGASGSATDTFPAGAAWIGLTPPSPGAEWGPVSGSWSLSVNGKGFLILGGVAGTTVGTAKVAAIPPAATSGADFPLIRIHNISGLARASRSIVGIGPPVDPPPASLPTQPTFSAANPTTGGVFAVLMNDVANGDFVDAAPLGVVACQLNYTDTSHTRAESVANDFTKLRSTDAGRARILWRERQSIAGSGTLGLQWAIVFLESGQTPTFVKHGVVEDATFGSAATGAYLQPITPGVAIVLRYVSNPLDPVSSAGVLVSGQMVRQSGVEVWLSMAPTQCTSRAGVQGLTDENGITWVSTQYCKQWPFE